MEGMDWSLTLPPPPPPPPTAPPPPPPPPSPPLSSIMTFSAQIKKCGEFQRNAGILAFLLETIKYFASPLLCLNQYKLKTF